MPIELGSFSLGALAGGMIVSLANHFLSKSRERESRKITDFNKAATDFQCAFIDAKQKLRDDPLADWNGVLNPDVLLEHERAALEFRQYLSANERTRFDKDWNAYFSHRPHPGDRHAPEKRPEEWDNEDNCKVFIEQIEKLLSYSKLK